ncbi:CPBP family intramembrane glutamic endopeptidase [Dyella choica]|uniref:CPBP family intramembrane metalloprotease n=1 Tax=Dyella choica TaxID=1927959 RepID=A0A3S0WVZ8_9GAMM|nr:type II CAAX endopeptidase family protein [Dyella choica]RUL75942.1 CPBP family intramembrane metalloprotease [Dyella choica]
MFVSGQRVAFAVPVGVPTWQRWLLYSSIARLVIFVAIFMPSVMVVSKALHALGWTHTAPPLQHGLGEFFGRTIPELTAFLLLARFIERRTPTELLSRTMFSRALIGLAIGTALFSAVVGVMWLLGSYQVVGFNPHANWVTPLLMVGLGAGIGEEILFRGALFRIVEEGLGSWAALLVSAAFFGLAHHGNPGATLWSSAAIAIEAGFLFGLLYMVTRSLPICMGLHLAWNFCQGTVYGIPVSGTAADGWLVSTRTGPDWLTGASFGAEASVVALTTCTLLSLVLLIIALKRGCIVSPAWIRRKQVVAPVDGAEAAA